MKKQFNYVKNLPKFAAVSCAILVVVALIVVFMGVELDIDFKGGSMITYGYDGEINIEEFAQKAGEILEENVTAVESVDIATNSKTIVLSLPSGDSISSEKMVEFTEGLQKAFPENNPHTLEISNVDAVIGRGFLVKSLFTLAIALILVMLYVALRFRKIGGLSAGAMGVVALLHDCLIVFGVFVIFRIPINENFLAVILTILGFSLNDTIVIYDRIRENKILHKNSMPLGDLVNLSINQSFTRSVHTTFTALIAMVAVTVMAVIYNVDDIFSFSFPLIFGLISGSYSTICLAGPLWVKWQVRKADSKVKR